jgi:helicase
MPERSAAAVAQRRAAAPLYVDASRENLGSEAFRGPGSALKVIVAAPTLAMGVITPAAAVAIVGLTHPGPVPAPYTVAEYKNMVGRADRLGFTDWASPTSFPQQAST